MNASSNVRNVTGAVSYPDVYSNAVAKNVIILALGITINYINGALIHTFRKHQVLNVNPRYILFIHLVVNDMIQLTTTISLFVLSYIFYRINASLCCLIIMMAVFTTLNTPLNLAVMAMECYIAVCLPLRHTELCTIRRTYALIGGIWALSAVTTLPDVFIFLATEPVQVFHSAIFCEINNVFRHPVHEQKKNVCYTIYLIGVWLTLLYTYVMIFTAAKGADGDAKKARNTILLHGFQLLLAILTYVYNLMKMSLIYWFPKHFVHVGFVFYIIIQILPRFISPIVYGLRDKMFRKHLTKYLLCTVRTSIKPWTAAKPSGSIQS
ncbi:odorant receptor 131-2-like [Labrus bergylta]|uniref:odorant receptor 131-2-like n=1 Tax=Labrus bergylta TaxID=56723 RepID=UPI00331411AD